jgi:hypothetical protein
MSVWSNDCVQYVVLQSLSYYHVVRSCLLGLGVISLFALLLDP